jgi:outer membrane immunogenic protein
LQARECFEFGDCACVGCGTACQLSPGDIDEKNSCRLRRGCRDLGRTGKCRRSRLDRHLDQRWLAGIEADFDWSDIAGNGSAPTTIFFGNNAATLNASRKVEWFGTLRARIGYLATPDLLLFATGGLAYGKVSESANVVLPPGVSNSQGNFGTGYACGGVYGDSTCFAGTGSRTSAGWTAGAGAEYRFSQHATVKLEYLYVNLGTNSFLIPATHPGALNPSVLNASSEAAFNLVRVGLNYRF